MLNYDADDIGIPKAWEKEKAQLKEKHKEDEGQQLGGLVQQKAEHTLSQVTNKKIENPRLFLQNIKEVENALKGLKSGEAQRLKAKLTPFMNDMIMPKFYKRQDIVIPADTQKDLIGDAAEADHTGELLNLVTRAFTEKHTPIAEQEQKLKEYKLTGKRAFNIVAKLRKIASYLLKHSDEHPESWKKYEETLPDGTKLYLVDGTYIRDVFEAKWYGGGHGYQDDFTPKTEIWVEIMKNPEDTLMYKFHETVEHYEMKTGKSYDDAHAVATQKEAQLRRIVNENPKIDVTKLKLTDAIEQYFPDFWNKYQ